MTFNELVHNIDNFNEDHFLFISTNMDKYEVLSFENYTQNKSIYEDLLDYNFSIKELKLFNLLYKSIFPDIQIIQIEEYLSFYLNYYCYNFENVDLLKLVNCLPYFNEYDTIFMSSPWNIESKYYIFRNDEEYNKNCTFQLNKITANNLTYLIECFIAQEFLEGYLIHKKDLTTKEQILALIEYAKYDG